MRLAILLLTACCAWPLAARAAVSDADRSFVAMVGQGGMFEVKAGRLAEDQGSTQDIRDQGNTEAHDHGLVGDRLTSAAAAAGIDVPTALNATFQKKYDMLKARQGLAFDAAYLSEMESLHAKDGAAFHKEAQEGTNAGLKAFAAETYPIVQRHIGELKAVAVKQ